MGALTQNLRYACRLLAKNPAFTAAAILCLALGIGATTAIFSVVNAVLLQPLPYKSPSELLYIAGMNRQTGAVGATMSFTKYTQITEQSHTLAASAGACVDTPTSALGGSRRRATSAGSEPLPR